jgi:hypothetical protein
MDQDQTRTLMIASGHCSIWTRAAIYKTRVKYIYQTRTLMIVSGYCFIWTRNEIYKTRIMYIYRPGPRIYGSGADQDLDNCFWSLLYMDRGWDI